MLPIRRLFFVLLLCWGGHFFAQDCALKINGTITDGGSAEPLSFATVYLEEAQLGVTAAVDGSFKLDGLCPGDYHLLVRHVGCEPERVYLELRGDTALALELEHHTELIDEVVVHGSTADNSTQSSVSISEEAIVRGGDGNLGKLLERIVGVSRLGNGTNIGKPVIHGMFGNRISMLNNGVAQSGQQWGNDHAPEIDPFVADHVSVLKGVSALQYGGTSLGGVVLVEPGEIEEEPHLHGRLSYIFASNGRGHTLNTRLEKASKLVNWRFTGTARTAGDNHTPDYFLRNTGRRELSGALQLEKQLSSKWMAELYFSHFYTELGVMRGSHIGNLTDLRNALTNKVPNFTEAEFSRRIDPPRQSVHHGLAKAKLSYLGQNDQKLTFTYAAQLNDRKEFDVRRGGRSEIPALSLQQWNQFIEADYSRPLGDFSFVKIGWQNTLIFNDNAPGTGVFPLIPDYDSWQSGLYATLKRQRGDWSSELGGRLDYIDMRVATFTQGANSQLLIYEPDFLQYSTAAGLRYQLSDQLELAANLGSARRAPAINELYSQGLHQGVSGIEEGDINLQPELSLKGTFSLKFQAEHWLFLQALTYYQRIQDYIYLQVQPDFRLTIRGAFPVFLYEQTDAQIAGLDLMVSLEPSENLKLVTQYSYLSGTDLSNDQPLVLMPPNRISSSLEYALADGKKLSNTQLFLRGQYTFRQHNLNAEQDLAAAPEGFFLLSGGVGTHLQLGGRSLHFNLRVDNALNTRYRDYLNRLRYFADEPGRNVVMGLNFEF